MPAPSSAMDVYDRVLTAVKAEPTLAQALVSDFPGTMRSRFGLDVPAGASLARIDTGFELSLDGRSYQLPDPARTKAGELNDAELELVAGGADSNNKNKSMQDTRGLPST